MFTIQLLYHFNLILHQVIQIYIYLETIVQLLLVCTVSRVTQQFNQFTACRKEEKAQQNFRKCRGIEASVFSFICQGLVNLLTITPAGQAWWKILVLMTGNSFINS